jgi:glycosyltransferase involved in cell wall biosynthesis
VTASPRLSAVLTTYNRAEGLDRTLKSLTGQTRLPDELIVADDHSTDGTEAVVERWAASFPRLRYERNARNLRLTGNLNAAVPLAQGEYVVLLQDADEYEPTFLSKAERALDVHPSAAFVFTGVGGFPHATRAGDGAIVQNLPPLTPGRAFFERHMLHRFGSIVWGTVMMRRAVLEPLMPFDATYGWVADVDMWMRMCLHGDVAYVAEPLVIADNSPTAERGFNWEHQDALHRMKMANARRFYADRPARVRVELAREAIVGAALRLLRSAAGTPVRAALRSDVAVHLRWRRL